MNLEESKNIYPNIGKVWTKEDYRILGHSIDNNHGIHKVSKILGRREIPIIIRALNEYNYFFNNSKNLIINIFKDDFIISLIYGLQDKFQQNGNKNLWTQKNIDDLTERLVSNDSLNTMAKNLDKPHTTIAVKIYRLEKIILPEVKEMLITKYKNFDFIIQLLATFEDGSKIKKNSISKDSSYFNWTKEEEKKLKMLYVEKLFTINKISEILVRPRERIITRIKFLDLDNKSPYKDDAEEILALLKNNDVKEIFHFTDSRNLDSIKQNGLFSMNYLKRNKIPFYSPDPDRIIFDDYISLSLTRNHPMMWQASYENRIIDPIVLVIDPEIMLFRDTFFTKGVSNKRGISRGDTYHFLANNIDLDINPSSDVEKRKVEILVKEKIDKKYILNLQS